VLKNNFASKPKNQFCIIWQRRFGACLVLHCRYQPVCSSHRPARYRASIDEHNIRTPPGTVLLQSEEPCYGVIVLQTKTTLCSPLTVRRMKLRIVDTAPRTLHCLKFSLPKLHSRVKTNRTERNANKFHLLSSKVSKCTQLFSSTACSGFG
jgi:hypothetical protein